MDKGTLFPVMTFGFAAVAVAVALVEFPVLLFLIPLLVILATSSWKVEMVCGVIQAAIFAMFGYGLGGWAQTGGDTSGSFPAMYAVVALFLAMPALGLLVLAKRGLKNLFARNSREAQPKAP